MKKEGRAEATIRGINKKLKTLGKYTNLDNPEAVKEHIANKKVSNTNKQMLVIAYNHYVVVNGLKWSKPVYIREENAIRVPTRENVERLVAYAGPKYSTIISVMKDTGARPCELERAKLRDMNITQKKFRIS